MRCMTPDDFSPSPNPAQVSIRDQAVHERAQELRLELDEVAAGAPDQVEGMRLKLEHAGRKMLDVMVEVDATTAVRNELVTEATETFRLPRSYVATAAVLTRGRVQQLIDRAREQHSCPVCDTTVPEPTGARRGGVGTPDGVAWQPWIQSSVCPNCDAILDRNMEAGPTHAWRLRHRSPNLTRERRGNVQSGRT